MTPPDHGLGAPAPSAGGADGLAERLARLTPAQLARLMQRAPGGAAAAGIPRRAGPGPWPLSFAQQRLWFVQQLDPASAAYNMVGATRLDGALDAAMLGRALDVVVGRHEALRTVFVVRGGEPAQEVAAHRPVELATEDAAAGPAELEAEVERRVRREQRSPFDLAAGPPLRAVLLRLAPERHVLVLCMHHAVSDGWSRGVIVRELSEAFTALVRGEEPRLPELPVQYPDYAVWQRARMSGDLLAGELAYWTGKLAGAPPTLALATDRPRPAAKSYAGAVHRFRVPARVAEALRALAREEEATPFMALLAAWKTLLARHAGQADVVVGTPVANRGRAETAGLVGFFANTLALRSDLSGDPGFREALRRVRETAVGGYAHEELPFERLVEELHPERGLGHSPVFQAMFLLDESPLRPFRLPGLELSPVDVDPGVAMFDLTLQLERADDGLAGRLEYATDLFDAATAVRMAEHLGVLLHGIAADPDTPLSALPLASAGERALLERWSAADRGHPADSPVHELFAAQAVRTPHAAAVVHGGDVVTYAELYTRANRLASHLRALGVGPEARVGICLERTPELLVALLAVLRAGGAYVPLDPAYPRERLGWMIEDAGIRLVLTATALADRVPAGATTLPLDALAARIAAEPADAPAGVVLPGSLSHVIFTSGSTGRPKGVMVRHSSVTTLLHWMRDIVSDDERATVLASTSVSFDVSVAEVWGTICWGGTLVLVENALDLPAVADREVRSACMVPAAAAELLRSGGIPASLRSLNLAGEALPADLARALYDTGTVSVVRNLYGPTEDTSYSTCSAVERGAERVLIGRPLAGTRAYVLDDGLRPAPLGVPGELYLAGAGLARGYVSRPDLTAERFLPDPFGPAGARMYRTHDRARWTEGGELEYLGRADFQLKVRGFRIEPGEVEAALRAHPALSDAVVVARADGAGEMRLVAYTIAAEGAAAPAAGELRAHLRERLPEYMVPSAIVELDALPLTPSGKTDRAALPAPDAAAPGEGAYLAPATPTGELLAGILAEVLGVDRVGERDDFFDLGGHSLLATRVAARVREAFGVDLPVRAVFEAPALGDLARRVDALRRGTAPADVPLLPLPRGRPLPLSFAQRRLWLLDRMEPGSAAYVVAFALRLRGALDATVLERSLAEVVRRHESLRTTLAELDGEPVQVVHPAGPTPIPVVDLRALPAEARDAAVRRLAGEEAVRPFDLARGPLLRCTLLRPGDGEHALLFAVHHAVCDGWSMDVLAREVSAVYSALVRGEAPDLPELPVQYADYAAWQAAWLGGPVLDEQLAHWRERLAGAPPLLELPTDRPRLAVPTGRGAGVPFVLPAAAADAVRALARREGATPFMALLAAWQLLLARYAATDDVVVGAPVAGRGRTGLEGLIGFFVNTLPMRADLGGDPPFRGLLARVREASLAAYAHADVPFERLVEELRPERSRAHSPLVQVALAYGSHGRAALRLGEVEAEVLEVEARAARFDLGLALDGGEGELRGSLTYRADLFDRASVERMTGHFAALLEAVAADASRPLSAYVLLPDVERRRLLEEWGASPAEAQVGGCVHDLFREQAARTPGAVAVVYEDDSLTYAELDARSDRLANHLRGLGIGPDSRVGVCLERGVELVVVLLAVLKAGGAYVPLDPAHPAERLLLVLEDASAGAVVTADAIAVRLAGFAGAVVRLDADRERIAATAAAAPMVAVSPENLAYLIYTSGSTGRPKGVMVEHRSVVNLHAALWRDVYARRGAAAPPRVSMNGPATFDTSVKQLVQLLGGATVCVVPEAARYDAEALASYLRRHAVEVLDCTPAQLRHLLGEGLLDRVGPELADLLVAGEAIEPELWSTLGGLEGRRAWNLYGPTECTVDAALCRVSGTRPVLGGPVAGARLYVLDASGAPAPAGVPGELHVGGAGVARGYVGRPELAGEKFVPDPFSGAPGARMYRTGDRTRWLADGSLEYLGRLDQQVKVRGFRIEPGEIEAALEAHPAVREAVVVAREDAGGERRLVGYVVAGAEAAVRPAELRAHLRARLPEYMVPAALVELAALPLTPNGKVDRRALPAPEGQGEDGEGGAPRTPAEEIVAGIFAAVLGVERVGARDDFFALGGHSLLATRVATRVRAALGAELPLRDFFRDPTVAGVAAWLDARRGAPARDAGPIERVAELGAWLPLSFAQQRLWLVHQMDPESRIYNQPLAFRLRGRLDARALARALTGLVRRHAVLRTRLADRDGVPGQVIDPPREVPLPLVDLSAHPAREEAVQALVRDQARRLFDLGSGVLLRAALARLSDDEHVLAAAMHHVAGDGWSAGILLREVAALYGAYSAGREPDLPEPPVQYADYAVWQRRWLTPEREAEQLEFWRRALADLPATHLAGDRSGPAGTGGATRTFLLAPELSEGVRALGRALGATPFMTLLAAFAVLLHRQGRSDEVVVGTDVANRNLRPETEGLIGFFVNQLVLRTRLDGAPRFRELVGRVRETTLAAYDHQDLPFDRVVEALRPRRAAGETPFFRVKFVLQNAADGEPAALPGLELEPLEVERGAAQLDLVLAMRDRGGRISGLFEYRTGLFSPEAIDRWVRRLEATLEAAVEDPDRTTDELGARLDAGERSEGEAAREALKRKRAARFAR